MRICCTLNFLFIYDITIKATLNSAYTLQQTMYDCFFCILCRAAIVTISFSSSQILMRFASNRIVRPIRLCLLFFYLRHHTLIRPQHIRTMHCVTISVVLIPNSFVCLPHTIGSIWKQLGNRAACNSTYSLIVTKSL